MEICSERLSFFCIDMLISGRIDIGDLLPKLIIPDQVDPDGFKAFESGRVIYENSSLDQPAEMKFKRIVPGYVILQVLHNYLIGFYAFPFIIQVYINILQVLFQIPKHLRQENLFKIVLLSFLVPVIHLECDKNSQEYENKLSGGIDPESPFRAFSVTTGFEKESKQNYDLDIRT